MCNLLDFSGLAHRFGRALTNFNQYNPDVKEA